ncbi:MAG: hypothetical protein H7X88_06490, partial [Gloeobacteraceae cyanobacterium ES-bin-316]|nr:hypothetical protein [Ferruginibacter sp.]
MKKIILMMLPLIAAVLGFNLRENIMVTGTVSDTTGNPVPLVSVSVKGS